MCKNEYVYILDFSNIHILKLYNIWESNTIRTVPEYGHSRYHRNHKSYKKILKNEIFIII